MNRTAPFAEVFGFESDPELGLDPAKLVVYTTDGPADSQRYVISQSQSRKMATLTHEDGIWWVRLHGKKNGRNEKTKDLPEDFLTVQEAAEAALEEYVNYVADVRHAKAVRINQEMADRIGMTQGVFVPLEQWNKRVGAQAIRRRYLDDLRIARTSAVADEDSSFVLAAGKDELGTFTPLDVEGRKHWLVHSIGPDRQLIERGHRSTIGAALGLLIYSLHLPEHNSTEGPISWRDHDSTEGEPVISRWPGPGYTEVSKDHRYVGRITLTEQGHVAAIGPDPAHLLTLEGVFTARPQALSHLLRQVAEQAKAGADIS